MSRKVCLYHRNCHDGLCAAAIVAKKFPKMDMATDFIAVDYTDRAPPWEHIRGNHVYIVDFCYRPLKLLQEIAKHAVTLTVLDHHKSAMEDIGPWQPSNGIVLFDEEKCGASLTWWFLFGDSAFDKVMSDEGMLDAPPLIRYVEDRDLWKGKFPETDAIWYFLGSYPLTVQVWHYQLKYFDRYRAGEAGRHIMHWVDERNKEWIDQWKCHPTYMQVDDDLVIPCMNVPKVFASKLAYLLALYDNAPAGCVYYRQDGKIVYSLRRNEDGTQPPVDVSQIAKRHGGGGHVGAASYQTDAWPILHKVKHW